MQDLKELRKEIDLVDSTLIEALKKRFDITKRIGEYKAETGAELFCPEREAEKLDSLRDLLKDSEYCSYIVDMFRCVMDYSKYQQSNNIFGIKDIYLIGMPGCGKSHIGSVLAGKTQRIFIDMDDLYEQVYGTTPEKEIETNKEDFFRKRESSLLKDISKHKYGTFRGDTVRGRIISCGGGIVTREENREYIKENSTVIYIKRDLEKLDIKGRPLSKQNGLDELFKARKEKYEDFSDISFENKGSIEDCVKEILETLKNVK